MSHGSGSLRTPGPWIWALVGAWIAASPARGQAAAPLSPTSLREAGGPGEAPADKPKAAPLLPEKGLPAQDAAATSPTSPPGLLDAASAGLPLLIWPEVIFKERFGLHEIDVRGHSYGTGEGVAGATLPLPSSGGDVSVTYRYHGLFGGVVRPVAGLALMAGEAFVAPHPASGLRPTQAAVLLPNAGLEVVVKGVGLGWRAGVPLWSWTSQQGFYHPQLGGPPTPGWRQLLLESLIQGIYPIWER